MTAPLLLAIDIGNTNTVFAVCEGDTVRGQWRAATKTERTADEYAVWLMQLMGLAGIEAGAIGDAIVSSVVPESTYNLVTLCRRYFGCNPIRVAEIDDIGIEIAVDRPHDVGDDRLVNAIGAHARYPGALVVIDFGTATTFDIVGADGAYRGGVIAPGVNLSVEALHMAAAKLPRVAVRRPAAVIGHSTVGAIQSGIYWGYVSLIEGMVDRIKRACAEPMTVVATGGLAPLFEAATPVIEHVDPDLTVRGLVSLHRGVREARP